MNAMNDILQIPKTLGWVNDGQNTARGNLMKINVNSFNLAPKPAARVQEHCKLCYFFWAHKQSKE